MRIGVVTLFPELIDGALNYGVIGRARTRGLLDLEMENPRDWAEDKHRTVDDRPFGGGPGMVMKLEPLLASIDSVKGKIGNTPRVVCLSPQGRKFNQSLARKWQDAGQLVLVAGRYEGIDERVMDSVIDEEISLGDYVLSGGEFAALCVIDAVARLVPGVLGDPCSSQEDSFSEDGVLDHPHYTRPERHEGMNVPEVLLSGDHRAIARWRRQQALERTMDRRPDLLERASLTPEDKDFLTRLGYGKRLPEDEKTEE